MEFTLENQLRLIEKLINHYMELYKITTDPVEAKLYLHKSMALDSALWILTKPEYFNSMVQTFNLDEKTTLYKITREKYYQSTNESEPVGAPIYCLHESFADHMVEALEVEHNLSASIEQVEVFTCDLDKYNVMEWE